MAVRVRVIVVTDMFCTLTISVNTLVVLFTIVYKMLPLGETG